MKGAEILVPNLWCTGWANNGSWLISTWRVLYYKAIMGKHTHTHTYRIKPTTAVFSCYEKNKQTTWRKIKGVMQSASVKTPQLFIHVTDSFCQGRPLLSSAVERLTTKQEKLFWNPPPPPPRNLKSLIKRAAHVGGWHDTQCPLYTHTHTHHVFFNPKPRNYCEILSHILFTDQQQI